MPSYYGVALDTIDQLRADVAERDAAIAQHGANAGRMRADLAVLNKYLAARDKRIAELAASRDNEINILANSIAANVETIAKLRADVAERDATIAKWEPTIAKQHDAENPHTHRRGGPPVGHHPIEIHGVRVPVRFGKSRPAGQRDPS